MTFRPATPRLAKIVGKYCIVNNGDGTYTAKYTLNPTITIGGFEYGITVIKPHLSIKQRRQPSREALARTTTRTSTWRSLIRTASSRSSLTSRSTTSKPQVMTG